jgi:hypothetical protein
MPMHYLWQVRQIVTFGNARHVDRCNQFGGGAAGRIWESFIALILWIGVFIKLIQDLYGYVDDEFSWDFANNLMFYPPYGKYLPTKQVTLLSLWDELGIPHEEKKQLWGSPLIIIGFEVDPNAMTITMSPPQRDELIAVICSFAVPGHRRQLREFQRLAGWINWCLNVYPLLRPGLSALYDKIRGKM